MSQATPYDYTRAQAEIVQIYDLHRTAMINVRYYGRRASVLAGHLRRLEIIAAVAASTTLGGLLSANTTGHWMWIAISGFAALATAISPVLKLGERVAEMEKLHFAYTQVFYSVDQLVNEIRSNDGLSDGLRYAAKVLFQQYSSLGPQDEIDPDPAFLAEAQSAVEKQFPADGYWLPAA
jgi:hypothetical protein